jgi:hypothetical protein
LKEGAQVATPVFIRGAIGLIKTYFAAGFKSPNKCSLWPDNNRRVS